MPRPISATINLAALAHNLGVAREGLPAIDEGGQERAASELGDGLLRIVDVDQRDALEPKLLAAFGECATGLYKDFQTKSAALAAATAKADDEPSAESAQKARDAWIEIGRAHV